MKPIRLHISVTLDEQGTNTLVDLIRRAVTTEDGLHSQKVTRNALIAGQNLPEDRGLLVDTTQVAKLLEVCERTVGRMHTKGEMPSPIRIGRAVRWNYEEIRRWVDAGCP
jgi:excisionase family DNA binding protein